MKKYPILFVAFVSMALSWDAAPAAAKTSLHYPVVYESNGKLQLVSTLNSKIKKAGLKPVPDYLVLTGPKQAARVIEKMSQYIESKVATALSMSGLEMKWADMSAVTSPKLKTRLCYTGKPADVVTFITNLAGSAFSDQQSVYAWKYKKVENNFWEDEVADEPSAGDDMFPDVWTNWRGEGDAILLLWAEGDGGDDENDAIIPKC